MQTAQLLESPLTVSEPLLQIHRHAFCAALLSNIAREDGLLAGIFTYKTKSVAVVLCEENEPGWWFSGKILKGRLLVPVAKTKLNFWRAAGRRITSARYFRELARRTGEDMPKIKWVSSRGELIGFDNKLIKVLKKPTQ